MKKNIVLSIILILSAILMPLFATPFNISSEDYKILMEKSLTSAGNNYRIKNVIQKLRNGDDVYVAALGGSVTEGEGPENFRDGYAYQFNKKLGDEFAFKREKIHFDNAGLSGTTSPLGLIRYKQDVVDVLGHVPSLLLIEFAVNDIEEPTKQRAFEALIHDVLSASEETAIIVVYSAAMYPKTQKVMMPIAEYYGVQQVSPSDAYDLAISKGLFKSNEYFKDIVHPLSAGHEFMADCIINLMKVIDKSSLDDKKSVPSQSLKSPNFFGFQQITKSNSDVTIIPGGFDEIDVNTQTIKKSGKGNFPKNWHHSSKSGKENFIMNINCKNLILSYKEQGSWLSEKFGKAEIYVDGRKIDTFDGAKANGWNNCVTLLLIDKPTSANHTVEIKMAKGSERKGFTIVCMGYSK